MAYEYKKGTFTFTQGYFNHRCQSLKVKLMKMRKCLMRWRSWLMLWIARRNELKNFSQKDKLRFTAYISGYLSHCFWHAQTFIITLAYGSLTMTTCSFVEASLLALSPHRCELRLKIFVNTCIVLNFSCLNTFGWTNLSCNIIISSALVEFVAI